MAQPMLNHATGRFQVSIKYRGVLKNKPTYYSVAIVDGIGQHTTKLLLDNKAVGSVIGSGGSVVNGIRQSSKARV